MTGRHHPTAPPDPAMLAPHPRTDCDRDRCGLPPWRPEDQSLYRDGYAAGWHDAMELAAAMLTAAKGSPIDR